MEISNELLAAYAAGNVSEEERLSVRQYLIENPNEMESLLMMMDEDYELELDDAVITMHADCQESLGEMLRDIDGISSVSRSAEILPITARAALNSVDNLCAVRCEGYILRKLGFDVSDDELTEEAKNYGILQPSGMALYNIGRLVGNRGLSVSRRYGCSLEEIMTALSRNLMVLAVVDGGELLGDDNAEICEDFEIGCVPDHVVIVESMDERQICLLDPMTMFRGDTYNHSDFVNAWADSACHLIIINNENDYEPHPIDLSDVTISPELIELQEAIAENAHEVWAYNRKKEGWTYGERRDDEKKLHPDMIAYNCLPESEKTYDREMALNTLKLVQKLGWEIKKRNV